jgi:hypothetical protein
MTPLRLALIVAAAGVVDFGLLLRPIPTLAACCILFICIGATRTP